MKLWNCFYLRCLGVMSLLMSAAWAAEEGMHHDPYASMSAALAIAIAAFGGAISQGKTASAALEAIGRNPAAKDKLFIPLIVSLALIESLVLYAFVIAFVKIKI